MKYSFVKINSPRVKNIVCAGNTQRLNTEAKTSITEAKAEIEKCQNNVELIR